MAVCLLTGAVGLQGAEETDPEKKPGAWIERGDGRFLRLVIEQNRFHLYFYDQDKNEMTPDALRAVIRFRHPVRSQETVTLLPRDGRPYLTNPRHIRAPFTFRTVVILVFDERGEKTESHPLFFRQEITPESSRVTGIQPAAF